MVISLLCRTNDAETNASGIMIEIKRKVYSQEEFNSTFHYQPERNESLKEKFKTHCCTCSRVCINKCMRNHLPVIDTLRTYQWNNWLLSDIVAGISVGVIHIPQGMGFSILASLPPVYGLYASFFPVIMYFFLGTSRHISFGTMAVISLLIATVVDRESERLGLDDPGGDTNMTEPTSSDHTRDAVAIKVGVACAVSLIVGIIQTLMGIMKLGVVASFMSMSFVGGFLMGAGFHIATSQLPYLFGLQIRKVGATGKIPIVFSEIVRNIPEAASAEVITSVLCIAFLTVVKEVINVRYRKHMWIPIPAEMIVVTVGIFVSYIAKLEDNFGVSIIGSIPQGIPMPEMPYMSNAHTYVVDAMIIALTSFIISVSMAKQFAKTYHYEIDMNQEFFAYGVSHTIGSFFHCFAGAQAPPRSFVHVATGGKTQLASVFSCGLVLLACTVMAPLFELLPKSVVASVVIVALFPLFKSFSELKVFWSVNRYDFVVWIMTWAVVVFVDVTNGLIAGIGLSLLTVIIQSKLAKGYLLASTDRSAHSGLYPPSTLYQSLQHIPGIRVFHFPNFLYFANIDNFKQQLFKATVNPSKLTVASVKDVSGANNDRQQALPVTTIDEHNKALCTIPNDDMKHMQDTLRKVASVTSIGTAFSLQSNYQFSKDVDDEVRSMSYIEITWDEDGNSQRMAIHKKEAVSTLGAADDVKPDHCIVRSVEGDGDIGFRCIIVDCSAMAYIDTAGLWLLKQLKTDYDAVGINFVLASCNKSLQTKLQRAGLIPGHSKVIDVYPTIHDAVVTNHFIEHPV